MPRTNLRPETKKKLAAKREEFLKELKEEREKPKREEALEAKAAAKKKAEDERMAKLTAAEQQKVRVFPFFLRFLFWFLFLVGVVAE